MSELLLGSIDSIDIDETQAIQKDEEDNTPLHLLSVPAPLRNDPLLLSNEYEALCYKTIFEPQDLKPLIIAMSKYGGYSDLIIAANEYIYRKKDQVLTPLLMKPLDAGQVKMLAEYMYDPAQVSDAYSPSSDLDDSYEINYDKSKLPLRARVNICSFLARNDRALKITLRDLPAVPPKLEDLNVHPMIRKYFKARDGLIAIAGQTGSGKTTLAAAMVRAYKEDLDDPSVILTYERPVEFVFDNIRGPNLVFQHTIGKFGDFSTFYDGLVNALRCTPEKIFIGEARDRETFENLPKIASSGHLGLTTLHARSVADIPTRIADEIAPDKAEGVVRQTIQYMHLAVYQALVKKEGGGVVPIVEILYFSDDIKKAILAQPYKDFHKTITEMINKHGVSLEQSAKKAFDSGLISNITYQSLIPDSKARGD